MWRGSSLRADAWRPVLAVAATLVFLTQAHANAGSQNNSESGCKKIYLTFDTGHMEIAPLVAEVLNRQNVKVTFFAANEATKKGDGSLGDDWSPWWKARAREGHEFASHTWNHDYWRRDIEGRPVRFQIKPSAGSDSGRSLNWSAAEYCESIARAANRLTSITGKKALPLFRAPGGKTSPALLAAAERCGFKHVGWSPAGFLGDELPSDRYPNEALLKQALASVRPGDILLAHLGIWSRQDPWAPVVLEPLIVGLKEKGFCFATLRQHPDFKGWIAAHGG